MLEDAVLSEACGFRWLLSLTVPRRQRELTALQDFVMLCRKIGTHGRETSKRLRGLTVKFVVFRNLSCLVLRCPSEEINDSTALCLAAGSFWGAGRAWRLAPQAAL